MQVSATNSPTWWTWSPMRPDQAGLASDRASRRVRNGVSVSLTTRTHSTAAKHRGTGDGHRQDRGCVVCSGCCISGRSLETQRACKEARADPVVVLASHDMRRRPPVPAHLAAALPANWRSRLTEYTAQYWRERKQHDAEDAHRAVDALWRQVKLAYPDWSLPEEREADLQMHILISAALARTAPNQTKAYRKPADEAAHRAESAERCGRRRKAL